MRLTIVWAASVADAVAGLRGLAGAALRTSRCDVLGKMAAAA